MSGQGFFDRTAAISRLEHEPVDVLVVGGGITGAGCALDAASRGLRVGLIERDDFASGTSSKSSKMIHGGLRYLQQGDFRLVYEALHERQRLRRNAPHLVKVLPFLLPVVTGRGSPVPRKLARMLGWAMWAYDLTGGARIGKLHERLDADAALAHFPTLTPERVNSAFLYYDARADDARLTLAIARTAAVDFGAVLANGVSLVGLHHDDRGRVTGARVEADGRTFTIRCKAVVNATGVWSDDVRALDEGTNPDSIRPAKGIHISVPWHKVRNDIAAVIPVTKDRRSIFVVPWYDSIDPNGDPQVTYLGTTDTDYDGPLDDPQCTAEDVQYILDAANAILTERLEPDDVLGTWAGLRPLVKSTGGSTKDLSRRHRVGVADSGVVTITGGKLTTYREMAADTIDDVVRFLRHDLETRPGKCRTANLALRGAAGFDAVLADCDERVISNATRIHLADRYGGETATIIAMIRADASLGEPLVEGLPYLRAEAVYAARYEMARTIDDVLSRRTRARLLARDASSEAAPLVAELIGGVLELSEAEKQHQIDDYQASIAAERTAPELPTTLEPRPGTPTPPIALSGGATHVRAHLDVAPVELDDAFLTRLRSACAEVTTDAEPLAEHSRDWWPLAMIWATRAEVPALAGAVARPTTAVEVGEILALCNEARIPVTTSGGRSGVCGAAVPVYGGVVLDTTAMSGIVDVDATSMVVDVLPGTFGDALEATLASEHGATVGHWPQSMTLATVGGWLACRGAGQYSTRYGKIEDIVVGMDVVLANGTTIHTGGQPRAAVGPDLNQQRRSAYVFDSFDAGLDACRRIMQRGATPAVLRLHDVTESVRFGVEGQHLVLILDEGDPAIIDASIAVAEEVCGDQGVALDNAQDVVGAWLKHRNDVAALEALITRGYVVDTMEVAGPWAALPSIYREATEAMSAVEGTMVVSCHQSHAYTDGACLYFTFAAQVDEDRRDTYYLDVWNAGTHAVLAAGGALSHHHGVGLNRSRFTAQALGAGHDTFAAIKTALDPHGILNPGKFGLPSPFGSLPWP